MSIQRTKHEIGTHLNTTDPSEMAVQLTIYCKGDVEGKQDALLMIADAWIFEMKKEGIDPLKAIQRMLIDGNLN